MEYEYVFDKDNIYAWAGSVDAEYYPGTTRIAVICLKWFAKFLIPDYCEEPNLPDLSTKPEIEIYTPEQQAEIMAWARSTKAPMKRQKRELLVALGFGAGLRSRELSALRVQDIEIDEQGVLIHSDGRVIPMVEKWTGPVRSFMAQWDGEDTSQWVISPRAKHRLSLTKAQLIEFDGGFEVHYRKIRATWIVEALQAYVPESVLLHTLGMVTLQKYLHLAPPDYSDPLRMRELFHRNEKRSRGGLRAV